MWIGALAINAGLLIAPFPYKLVGIIWPAIGIAWLLTKLDRNAHKYTSDRWTEFLVAFKTDDGIFTCLYMWPLDMLLSLTGFGPQGSFREQLEHDVFNQCYVGVSSSHGHDSAVFASRRIFKTRMRETEELSVRTKQLPGEISADARTACVCGATVVTLASTSATATEAPLAQAIGTNPPMKVTGWVSVVSQQKQETDDKTDLKFARVRISSSGDKLIPGFFTEFDGAQLSQSGSDWIKQYYLTSKVSDALTINAGRMAVAPVWMLPPPFLAETINYPRIPYSFYAYALQADAKMGSWRVLADISGKGGLRFNDGDQFDRIEGSVRVEHRLARSLTLSVTAQTSADFVRESVDIVLKPHERVDVKGAFYAANEHSILGRTSAYGGYLYAGIRPFEGVPGLELHGQADFRTRFGSPATDPVILTAGMRLLLNKGSQSLTADYQLIPSHSGKPDSGTLFLRAQTRF